MHETAEIGHPSHFSASRFSLRAALAALAAVSATTTICFLVEPWLPIANIVVSHLIAVLLIAIYLGRSASVIASLISFLAINFLAHPVIRGDGGCRRRCVEVTHE
jgi:K+-sensing histidine kinase KdpD